MFTHTTKVDARPTTGGNAPQDSVPLWRGLGWVIEPTPAGNMIQHSGSNRTGFRSYCEFDPKHGSGIVIMTNSGEGDKVWKALIKATRR
jgi:hypothetical protein